jgi:restriction endonuclease Mrr
LAKKLSPAATVALKEALCAVYWYKADLRSFLQQCLSNAAVLSSLNWNNYKRQIVSDLVDYLTRNQDRHVGDLTRLCHEVCAVTTFGHLEQLDGGAEKAERARTAVLQLKRLVEPHGQVKKERDDLAERQKRAAEKLQANAAVRLKLEDIKQRYMELVMSTNLQARGFELEKVMYDLFELFDLDPKASFRNTGEQIDGAFALEGTDYLFEAKWQQEPVNAASLDSFAAKVRRKLENTLGVFLSINSFSQDGVDAHSSGGAVVILMDGADLMAVLEERIDFVSLLLRKKRHAAQTGNIYLRFYEILLQGDE